VNSLDKNKKTEEACDAQSCKDNLMMGLMEVLAEAEESKEQEEIEKE